MQSQQTTQWQDYKIVGSYNNQRVSGFDAERTVNMFEYVDNQGKKNKVLFPTAGLTDSEIDFAPTSGGFRAQFVFTDQNLSNPGTKMYMVIGSDIYYIDTSLTKTLIGTITTNVGYVGVDANTYQVIFVDGQKGYIWDTLTLTFSEITDTGFPVKPIDVCYLDGFFVVANGDTNTFQLSSFNQGLIWSGFETPFTSSDITDLLTVGNTDNFQTGVVVEVSTEDGGVLPMPLAVATFYYAIQVSATTLHLASTYDNAVNGIFIDLTSSGSGFSTTFTADSTTDELAIASSNNFQTPYPVTVSNTGGALPSPLVAGTVYYCINIDTTHIKLATTAANANANIAIDITTNGTGTNTITIAGTTDIRVFGEFQLGAITTHPGTIVACKTLHRRLFLFSQNFTEVWENAGAGTNLPFRRNNSLLIEYGTPAIASVKAGFDRMFFLSQDKDGLGSVMEVIGANAFPVSNRALDFQLSQYAQDGHISDATGILIKENGLIFYRLNFTQANHTFVFNYTMSDNSDDSGNDDNSSDYSQRIKWHEEEVLNGDRHPAQTHGYLNGINYYGDYKNPILYIVDTENNTNNGESIRRMRIGQPIGSPVYKRIRIDRFQLDVKQGDIDDIPNNTAPIIFLSYSKDGGETYGPKLESPMGQIGQRSFRTVWRKLGVVPRGQYFVPKIEFFNKVKFVILGAAWIAAELPE